MVNYNNLARNYYKNVHNQDKSNIQDIFIKFHIPLAIWEAEH